MINNSLLVLSLSGLALGIVACFLLLFSNKNGKDVNRLLAVAFICMIAIQLATFLFVWNIDLYAYIYRFPSPLFYLLLPVSYLYIRKIVNDETHLKKRDSLHFLLPVCYFIEIFPVYFSSYAYRRSMVAEIVKKPYRLIDLNEGLLPSFYNTTLLSLQAVAYIILIVMLLTKAVHLRNNGLDPGKADTVGWVKTFTFLLGINFLPMLCFFLCPASLLNDALQFILIILTISFLGITLYLFTKPGILYGLSQPAMNFQKARPILSASKAHFKMEESYSPVGSVLDKVEKKLEFSNLERYKPLLETYMQLNKPFLKQGYSINALSNETGIPQHHLSSMINRVYEMRFNEYLNRLRIDYISENFKNPEWEKLTLEGIAKQAGFTSRTTFFNTIKKITGLSPSEYVAQIKQKN
jgi:AraC-like DNA-binding protein